jgi:hypothetical protein
MIPETPHANASQPFVDERPLVDEAPIVESSYEDDENHVTRLLRALFIVFAGGLLLWAQWHSPNQPVGQNWSRWIWTSVIFNFALPLGIVWLFFGQGLSHLSWLKDQRNNAWSYGFGWFSLPYHLPENEVPIWKIGRFTFLKVWHPAYWNAERFNRNSGNVICSRLWLRGRSCFRFCGIFRAMPRFEPDYAVYLPPVNGSWAIGFGYSRRSLFTCGAGNGFFADSACSD